MRYLPRVAKVAEFVNADSIARGLSPLNEQAVQIEAGRVFLQRIAVMIRRGDDFAFETTLSGRAYVRLFGRLREAGFNADVIEEHRRAGKSIVVARDGKPVRVDPNTVRTVREERPKYGRE